MKTIYTVKVRIPAGPLMLERTFSFISKDEQVKFYEAAVAKCYTVVSISSETPLSADETLTECAKEAATAVINLLTKERDEALLERDIARRGRADAHDAWRDIHQRLAIMKAASRRALPVLDKGGYPAEADFIRTALKAEDAL
jgi:hypothetical protein